MEGDTGLLTVMVQGTSGRMGLLEADMHQNKGSVWSDYWDRLQPPTLISTELLIVGGAVGRRQERAVTMRLWQKTFALKLLKAAENKNKLSLTLD